MMGGMGEDAMLFQSRFKPEMGIRRYLERICGYSGMSGEALVLTIIYLMRFGRTNPAIPITEMNLHRLTLAASICAAKIWDDEFVNNARFAKIGGVSLAEMNALEAAFCRLIDFRLFVDPAEYRNIVQQMLCDSPVVPLALGSQWATRPASPTTLCASTFPYADQTSRTRHSPPPPLKNAGGPSADSKSGNPTAIFVSWGAPPVSGPKPVAPPAPAPQQTMRAPDNSQKASGAAPSGAPATKTFRVVKRGPGATQSVVVVKLPAKASTWTSKPIRASASMVFAPHRQTPALSVPNPVPPTLVS
jgi:hypothetical protein